MSNIQDSWQHIQIDDLPSFLNDRAMAVMAIQEGWQNDSWSNMVPSTWTGILSISEPNQNFQPKPTLNQ